MTRKLILTFILLLALLLRVWKLGTFPVGFTQDEAGIGYDAYSILQTGKDQWGVTLPLTLRSFGDFKFPLYSYLAIPSVAVFGLNEFSVRLPNALIGTLAVFATYLMVLELSKKSPGFNGFTLAILSAFLLAISPWHIGLSRGAFEANLTTFFIPIGLWAYLRGLTNRRYMAISALAFGLNLFSYYSARFVTPIFVILLLIFKNGFSKTPKLSLVRIVRENKVFLAVFGIFVLAVFYSVLLGANRRALDVSILRPTDNWASVSTRRYEAVQQGFPDQISRIFSNRYIFTLSQFTKSYLSYFSPNFLFNEGAGEWNYGLIPGTGVLYPIELIFLIVSFVVIIKGKGFAYWQLIVFLVLLAPIPTALSKTVGFAANKVAIMMPAIQVLSAFGIYLSINWIREKVRFQWLKTFLIYGIFAVLGIFLIFFLEDYFYHTKIEAAVPMQYGEREAFVYVNKIAGNYETIYVGRGLGSPNIWVEFYEKWDPREVQLASQKWLRYQQEGFIYLDRLEGYWLGKYRFGSLYYNNNKDKQGILFVGKPEEFSEKVTALHTVYYPDGKPAILIVDPSSL